MTSAEQLAQGVRALGLDLSSAACDSLLAYARLLAKWNRVYNLTAVREEAQIISHHLLDSLSVVPQLKDGGRLADVGSGGGLPGLPIAVARPDLEVVLIESNHKKSAFQQQARIELGLHNVLVHCGRVEDWHGEPLFGQVISRAFSDLADFVKVAGPLVAPGGVLLAMKGVYPYEELAQIPAPWRVVDVVPLTVPGLAAQRHLVRMERQGERDGST